MRLAIHQSAGGGLTPEQRLARLAERVGPEQENPSTRIDMLLCPELFYSGYNVGDELNTRADTHRGEVFETFSRLAKTLRTAIVYGYPERDGEALFNAAACVSANGELVANHRKQLNSPGSFEEDYFTPGEGFTLFDYAGFKIALLICYEVEFPESVRQVADMGAQLVLVPTALVSQWDVVASKVVPARAFENGVWLAYANHAGNENGFEYLGGSKIVAPDGEIEADAGRNEALITAVVDPKRVTRAQARLPYLRDFRKLAD